MTRSGVLAQIVAVVLVSCAAAAFAQLRTIPPGAQRGWIRHAQEMQVLISGKRLQLAPGAQIRDAENRIVVPAALPAGVLVKYTLDRLGQVNRVWILTDVEAAQPDPRR
jgi:hypothetical protein